MVVDEKSLKLFRSLVNIREGVDGTQWVGIWHLIVLKHLPYDETLRNGKFPKILLHRLFPEAEYSIWIDAKMELIGDTLLVLERYLRCEKHTFAIAQHKYRRCIYEEDDANKQRKRYCRRLVDLQMKIYRYEGMELRSSKKGTISDVPEGAIIIREHTTLNNLFSCLWFNEVDMFTPRDQLSFGCVMYRLGNLFKPFLFPNCEYNSLFLLYSLAREHSSPSETGPNCDKLKGLNSSLMESKAGFGLWTILVI